MNVSALAIGDARAAQAASKGRDRKVK